MPQCDRCDADIPISTTDLDDIDELTEIELRKLQTPSDEPFTIIEGAFAAWTADLDVEKRGRFPLLLCRSCTKEFVEWVDNPDVSPNAVDDYDFTIEWSYVDD